MDRLLRVTALIAAAVTVLLAAGGAILRTLGPATPQSFNISSPVVFWVGAAVAATYAAVGFVLARRLPRHPVPWLFTGIGVCIGGIVFTWAYSVVGSSAQPPLAGVPLAALVNAALLQPASLTLAIVLLFLFPDGRPTDTTSRLIMSTIPIAAGLLGLGLALTPGSIGIFAGLESPLAVEPAFVGRGVAVAGAVAIIVVGSAGCRSLIQRYRAADDRTRLQIRWFLWAGTVGALVAGLGTVVFAVAPAVLTGPGETLVMISLALASALVPIACAIGILRYRLYDIDRIISRTFVYGSLLALIAGAYSAGVAALQRISIALTGGPSDFNVVLITLLLAVSFEPVKRRLQKFAERFKEPEPAASPPMPVPMPDDAWIETVAARVAELLKTDAAASAVSVRRRRGRAVSRPDPDPLTIATPIEDRRPGS